jgi:hypothetical protein
MKQTSLFESFEKLNALDELFESSAAYRSSQNFFSLLKFIQKFPSLSPFNAFLIHMQNPGVELVMNARKWKVWGRKVKPNARPLVILIPFGPVDFVYDLADTEGSEVPALALNPFHTAGSLAPGVYEYTNRNCASDYIRYDEEEMSKNSAGYATLREKDYFKVVVNKFYKLETKYSTLVHELAHVYAGHLGCFQENWWKPRNQLDQKVEEIEAESISYLVCKRLGLKTSSEAYLSDYIKKHEEMPDISLEAILTVSGYIENLGKPGFRPKSKR